MNNFIFFGTPEVSNIALKELIKNGWIPSAVVCNPDAPTGRKRIIAPPPVKVTAKENNIKVLQPEKIDEDFLKTLKNIDVDFYLIVSYGKILPKALLDIPKFGAINIHPSLLPKYRGASPVPSAILNGEEYTGVTIYLLDEKMDHGPIIAQERYRIELDDNTKSLFEKLFKMGADMVIENIPKYMDGSISLLEQNHSEATYTKKFVTSDGFIEYKNLEKAQNIGGEIAKAIDCKIRALHLEPGCWTMKDNKRIKLLDSGLVDDKLKLKIVQHEGKKPIKIESVL